jgi:DNA repair protein RAD57
MSDILQVLAGFPVSKYTHILPSLDKASITTVDLVSLSPSEIGKRAQVPPVEVDKLSSALVEALQKDLTRKEAEKQCLDLSDDAEDEPKISTLDAGIDAALEGGVRPGYITEITGER